MKSNRIFFAILLFIVIATGAAGCAAYEKSSVNKPAGGGADPVVYEVLARALMDGISPNVVDMKPIDNMFNVSMADFSIELFKKGISDKENSLISPLSVMLALAMTANGADNETLAQMEALLGGGIPLNELNEYLYSYAQRLPSGEKSKLSIANSIWFRDDDNRLHIEPDFLQRNADYYNAAAYASAFNAQTVRDINNWVKSNTNGMIKEVLCEIDDAAVLYLINAVVFDAEWAHVYDKANIGESVFTNIHGARQNVDFMRSSESRYIDDGMATGFVKPYVSGYSFAALLPNETVSIEAYIESLTGDRFLAALERARDTVVSVSMPKFGYEYEISLKDPLISLGIPNAFRQADFSKMGSSPEGGLYIEEVLHKTFISVDELGTKAGAVTMAEIRPSSAPSQIRVQLDRPFIYAIIDNATSLPIFIGTVMTV